MVTPNESLLSNNTSRPFEKHLFGPCRPSDSVPEFAVAAVVQECKGDTSHCLKKLAPMQSLLIPLISSDVTNLLELNSAVDLSK